MPRFVSVTPTYSPFSLDEMLKIPMIYDANFREIENKYNELQDKTALLRLYAKNNPEIAAALENYDNGIQSIANAIEANTWNRDMSIQGNRMRSLYRNNIIPLASAVQQYENFMQNYLKDMDGTEIGERPTIKWFMEHPGEAPETIHGSAIQAQLAKAISNYALTRQIDISNTNNWKRVLGGQYLAGYTGAGYTDEEIADYFNNPANPNYAPITTIVNNFKHNIGYHKMTPERQAEADAYINSAIQMGMTGNRKMERIANKNYRSGSSSSSGADPLQKAIDEMMNLAGQSNQQSYGGYLYQKGGKLNQEGNQQKTLTQEEITILQNMPNDERARIAALPTNAEKAGAMRMYLMSQTSPQLKTVQQKLKNPFAYKANLENEMLKNDFNTRAASAQQEYWKKVVAGLPYTSTKGLNKLQRKELEDYINAARSQYVTTFQNPVSGIALDRGTEDISNEVEEEKSLIGNARSLQQNLIYFQIRNDLQKGNLAQREEKAKKYLEKLGLESYPIKTGPAPVSENEDSDLYKNLKAVNKVVGEHITNHINTYGTQGLRLTAAGLYEVNIPRTNITTGSPDYYAEHNLNRKNTRYTLASRSSNSDVLDVIQTNMDQAISLGYKPTGKDKYVQRKSDGNVSIQRVDITATDLINRQIRVYDEKNKRHDISLETLNSDRIMSSYNTWVDRLARRYNLTRYTQKQVLTYLNNVGILGEEMNDFVLELQWLLGTTKDTPMPTESQVLKQVTGYAPTSEDEE